MPFVPQLETGIGRGGRCRVGLSKPGPAQSLLVLAYVGLERRSD